MNILLYGYEFVLLAYTGWRTWDFLSTNLPVAIATEIALLGIFALDAGLIAWHTLYRKFANSESQETTAKWLVVVDFAGSLGAGVADMIIRQTMITYSIPPLLAKALIFGIPLIVAINVAAVLYYQANDPDEREERARRRVEAKIRSLAIQDVEDSAEAIAVELKKDISEVLKKKARENITGRYLGRKSVEPVNPAPSKPGKNGYGTETIAPDPTMPAKSRGK